MHPVQRHNEYWPRGAHGAGSCETLGSHRAADELSALCRSSVLVFMLHYSPALLILATKPSLFDIPRTLNASVF